MKTTTLLDLECIVLENPSLQVLVARTVGPRILSLRFQHGGNLLAELPDFVYQRPDGKAYRFYGGHRLWLSPEHPILSYSLDDQPVDITPTSRGLLVRKPVEPETGIQKSILLELHPEDAVLTLTHTLSNLGSDPIRCAPWAITQFRLGGVALLPQPRSEAGLLPNRLLALWPYSNIASPHLALGNDFIILRAAMQSPFKIGFANPCRWLAYWLDGILFVKRAPFDSAATYGDFGSSSECFCNRHFLELETLAPLTRLEPGGLVTLTETWHLYPDVPPPQDEEVARLVARHLGLE